MWISNAYAQSAQAGGGDMILQFLPLILIFVVFYFLLLRPQQRKMKEHKAMLAALRRGDRVVTGGGLIGTVTKVNNEREVTVEIAPDIKVRAVRETIQQVMEKKPAPADKDEDEDEEDEEEGKA